MGKVLYKGISEENVQWLGIPILSLIIMSTSDDPRCHGGWTNWIGGYMIVTVYTGLLWIGNALIFYKLKQKYRSIEETSKRIIGILFYSAIYTLSVFHILHFAFSYRLTGGWSWEFYSTDLRTTLVATIIVTFMYESRHFFKEWNKSKMIAEQLRHETTQAQLSNLQNQVNPHFLFNTLNTLSSLIHEDNTIALDFVHHMSHVYRYVLKSQEKQLVTLAEELQFAESFIHLLKARYRDTLHIHFAISVDEHSVGLPPASLQILLENVIKHNSISKDQPLDVQVYTKEGFIYMIHDRHPKLEPEPTSGTGLANIKKRYNLLGAKEPIIESTENHFLVAIPLIDIDV